MNPSCNLFLIGPTGAGKTSVGRRLALHYGLQFIDLDHEIEQHTGVDITTIFEIEGESKFRQRERFLLAQFSHYTGVLLSTGAGAVLDSANRQILVERGYVVWLKASVEQQLERLERDTRRPLLAGTDRRQRLQDMARVRNPLYQQMADLMLPGDVDTLAAAGDRGIELIDQHWQRPSTEPTQNA